MTVLTYPNNDIENCSTAECIAAQACLPVKKDCNFSSPLFGDKNGLFNCNLCAGDKYFAMPFVRGDKIPFQMRLPDCLNDGCDLIGGWKDNTNEDYYIGAELLSEGEVVYEHIGQFSSDYVVGLDSDGIPYQNFVVDTSVFEEKCFQIAITYYCKNADGEYEIKDSFVSEPFVESAKSECTIVLESELENSCDGFHYGSGADDCHYGTSDFAYSNRVRLPGSIYLNQVSFEDIILDNGDIASSELRENYTVDIYCVPPYAVRLLKEVLQGRHLTIDGVSYEKENITISKGIAQGRMWDGITFSVYRECSNDNCN